VAVVKVLYPSAREDIRGTLRLQYIACNTDMYDAEVLMIYNIIEAITVIVR